MCSQSLSVPLEDGLLGLDLLPLLQSFSRGTDVMPDAYEVRMAGLFLGRGSPATVALFVHRGPSATLCTLASACQGPLRVFSLLVGRWQPAP